MKILIAEDDESIRSLLCEVLEFEGHQCETAIDGLAAMRLFEAGGDFELLISDYQMPNTDGLGLLRWCREKNFQLPVILLSASRTALGINSISAIPTVFLPKPISIDDLLRAVRASH